MRTIVATCVLILLAGTAQADARYRLVLGSFASQHNAARWAETMARALAAPVEVMAYGANGVSGFRVVTQPLDEARILAVTQAAQAQGVTPWRLLETASPAGIAGAPPPEAPAADTAPTVVAAAAADVGVARASPPEAVRPPRTAAAVVSERAARDRREVDDDLGFQSRSFAHEGIHDQGRFQPSLSARLQYYRSWNDDEITFRAIPFVRLDAEDDRRTHADLREFQLTRVADDWELHAGVRQVFWGVTEFVHLVDIVNQIDLVENIDGEDRLGQPMIDLSLIRGWGVLDFMLLPGFRERTFPGQDGRLRFALPVDADGARYESEDEEWHVDAAVRWMHHVGPLEFGLYHFRGTGREPDLVPTLTPAGRYVLTPYYPQIDQTGLDAQAIVGDWALKLEALNRGGQGDRFWAATGGFEWTWVGAFDSRSDLGLVLEYMYDERGDRGPSVWEHDVGFATRWRFNDVADTQGLLGVTWDHESDEYVVKLEGTRRLGDAWSMVVEGRLFGGGRAPPTGPAEAVLAALTDPDNKTGAVQQDDYLQLELIRFF